MDEKSQKRTQRNSSWIVNPFRSTGKRARRIHTHKCISPSLILFTLSIEFNSLSFSACVYIVHTHTHTSLPPASLNQMREELWRDEISVISNYSLRIDGCCAQRLGYCNRENSSGQFTRWRLLLEYYIRVTLLHLVAIDLDSSAS